MNTVSSILPVSDQAASPVGNAPVKPLLFVHIPKTAGTSFIAILRNLFGDDRVVRVEGAYERLPAQIEAVVQRSAAEISCVTGHVPLHLWGPHMARFRPFTMLREPVARVLSLYRFLRRGSAADLAELGLAPGFSFEDFITCRAAGTYGQVSNGMCRMLSAMPAMQDGTTEAFWQPEAMTRALETAFGFLQRTDFGVVEDMPASLRLVRDRWNIPFRIEERHENATVAGGVEASVENIRRIVELNAADIALYHAASALFRERTAYLQEDGAAAGGGAVWTPVLGQSASLATIPSRQGFHDFEATAGFAWLMAGAPAQLYFAPPGAAGHLPMQVRLRIYLISPSYDATGIGLRLNGKRLPVTVTEEQGHWRTLTAGPLAFGPGVQHLCIEPPYAVPVRFLVPGSKDLRDLSFALSSVTFSV